MPLEAHTVSRCCWIAAVDARADDLAAQRLALDIELMQDVAQRRALACCSSPISRRRNSSIVIAAFLHARYVSPPSRSRHRQELLLVAAEGESGKQQTFRRDAANVPACGPPGWGDRERANDIAAPMAAKVASRMMTSRLADNSCCGPAWSVLWPDPVRTASRHARSAEAPATPTLMPQQRTRLISPPASPVSDAGAALMMALLLGERKSPWPMPSPNSASASVTAGKLAGAPSSTANSRASAATQMSMPDTVSGRAPRRS